MWLHVASAACSGFLHLDECKERTRICRISEHMVFDLLGLAYSIEHKRLVGKFKRSQNVYIYILKYFVGVNVPVSYPFLWVFFF